MRGVRAHGLPVRQVEVCRVRARRDGRRRDLVAAHHVGNLAERRLQALRAVYFDARHVQIRRLLQLDSYVPRHDVRGHFPCAVAAVLGELLLRARALLRFEQRPAPDFVPEGGERGHNPEGEEARGVKVLRPRRVLRLVRSIPHDDLFDDAHITEVEVPPRLCVDQRVGEHRLAAPVAVTSQRLRGEVAAVRRRLRRDAAPLAAQHARRNVQRAHNGGLVKKRHRGARVPGAAAEVAPPRVELPPHCHRAGVRVARRDVAHGARRERAHHALERREVAPEHDGGPRSVHLAALLLSEAIGEHIDEARQDDGVSAAARNIDDYDAAGAQGLDPRRARKDGDVERAEAEASAVGAPPYVEIAGVGAQRAVRVARGNRADDRRPREREAEEHRLWREHFVVIRLLHLVRSGRQCVCAWRAEEGEHESTRATTQAVDHRRWQRAPSSSPA